MRPERQVASAIGAGALLGCSSAWAHGVFGGDVSIWTATQHFFTSPLSLAALTGLAAAIFGIREPASIVASALAAAAAVLATVFLALIPPFVAPAAVVVIGLSAVAGWNFSAGPACILAALAGLAAGAAADLQPARWQELAGLGATVFIVTFWLLTSADNLKQSGRLPAVVPVARRVLGSWVAAMALLLTALALLGKNT